VNNLGTYFLIPRNIVRISIRKIGAGIVCAKTRYVNKAE